ncbi:hypothetical protein COV53_04650 [Candidatus Gottesmanbacteria bacterium CG11_big_fil_rev_8_21_14_0_20_37_11]|uniref:Uncharacterized protein n=3 Tax=Candidatus Gottesmaniibacteriota TaxID=1752720 RepID=A0A2M7RRU0_9BACT|nr:MAG: hypothetical protein AUJ73_02180 [Candidatus Gottesmanbacteria bacterium CG1_02_37_22]PIP33111.1 MAG: hypothetical protein COX23_01085 [Candidatus Gottesmanbacteria bacterium CG23_combo_of_CG06-09_8_20_14_all_37_19]PIR08119.1 MAG: hypothetical protein COV53_04650 [Candidatus Gottesmanbacteria bacterium CG11_big_fil_rev_8_21_14_0_20_37_11]PIZ02769.1 MAG: hypothetical protein COY59_02980 [Candidatus Gottesmanbacteria bacterium CG_4_10_14_0_8_um_filter_37_24]
MNKWWHKFYSENKTMIWAAIVAIILSLGILWKVKDEVTRFTLIMPVFAGFILFSILITSDEELEDKTDEDADEKKLTKSRKKK